MKKIVILLSGLLLSSQVTAACKTQNLDGDWVMYQVAVSPIDAAQGKEHTGKCELNIVSGDVSLACDMTILPEGVIAGGTGNAYVNDDCSVEMDLTFANGLTSSFDLQLSNNKQAFIGRWVNAAGVVGTTSAMQR